MSKNVLSHRVLLVAFAATLAGASVSVTAHDTAAPAPAPAPSSSHQGRPPALFTPAAPAGDALVYRTLTVSVFADGFMILPLDRYDAYSTSTDEQSVYEAATKLETACMRAAGTTLPSGYGGSFLPSELPLSGIFGVSDLQDAEHHGYRVPDSGASSTAPVVSTAQFDALYGTRERPSGCALAAAATLDVSQANQAWTFVQGLRLQTLASADGDPRIVAANKAWSACMAAAGYHYANPLQPGRDRSLLGRGLEAAHGDALPPPSPAEEAAATSDVRCKQKTGYINTFAVVWAGYQEQVIQRDEGGLAVALGEWHAMLQHV